MSITEIVKKYLDKEETDPIVFTAKDLGLSFKNILEALEELDNLLIQEDNIVYKYIKYWNYTGEQFSVTLNREVEI